LERIYIGRSSVRAWLAFFVLCLFLGACVETIGMKCWIPFGKGGKKESSSSVGLNEESGRDDMMDMKETLGLK